MNLIIYFVCIKGLKMGSDCIGVDVVITKTITFLQFDARCRECVAPNSSLHG